MAPEKPSIYTYKLFMVLRLLVLIFKRKIIRMCDTSALSLSSLPNPLTHNTRGTQYLLYLGTWGGINLSLEAKILIGKRKGRKMD